MPLRTGVRGQVCFSGGFFTSTPSVDLDFTPKRPYGGGLQPKAPLLPADPKRGVSPEYRELQNAEAACRVSPEFIASHRLQRRESPSLMRRLQTKHIIAFTAACAVLARVRIMLCTCRRLPGPGLTLANRACDRASTPFAELSAGSRRGAGRWRLEGHAIADLTGLALLRVAGEGPPALAQRMARRHGGPFRAGPPCESAPCSGRPVAPDPVPEPRPSARPPRPHSPATCASTAPQSERSFTLGQLVLDVRVEMHGRAPTSAPFCVYASPAACACVVCGG